MQNDDEQTQSKSTPSQSIYLVCGRLLTGDSVYYPQADYQGQRLLFCTESCLGAFYADPEAFIAAHSRADFVT